MLSVSRRIASLYEQGRAVIMLREAIRDDWCERIADGRHVCMDLREIRGYTDTQCTFRDNDGRV
jgi:hypothetical protein